MPITKTCKTCKRDKPFSYYKPLDPNIKVGCYRGNESMKREFSPEDLEDICITCKEKRVFRFERAEDNLMEDYVFGLSATPEEFTSEDLEWWTFPEEEAHQFSMPQKKEWFKCKTCNGIFPREAKYLNRYYLCRPCGLAYNRANRVSFYYRNKETNKSPSKETVGDVGGKKKGT